jgi:hypothetical protein
VRVGITANNSWDVSTTDVVRDGNEKLCRGEGKRKQEVGKVGDIFHLLIASMSERLQAITAGPDVHGRLLYTYGPTSFPVQIEEDAL